MLPKLPKSDSEDLFISKVNSDTYGDLPDHHSSTQSNTYSQRNDRVHRFFGEFFSNSGHFLILKSLSDITLYGWLNYLTDPTEYLLILAMVVQTWYLSRSQSHYGWGNLIGFAIYTIIDLPNDGWQYFLNYTHLVFGLFSLSIAILQTFRYHLYPSLDWLIIPLENFVRTLMIFAFYIAVKAGNYQFNLYASDQNFLQPQSHKFLLASLGLVGLFIGLRSLQLSRQRKQLQKTAKILQNLAEWGLGSHVVKTAVTQPEALTFQKCDRTILFMDIRGFTAWCEQHQPEQVAALLNDYYHYVEPAASQYQPIRITFTGDEIMAIYATPVQGIEAAQAMQKVAQSILNHYNIGVGCGVHCGTVIEGLFGSQDVKTFTVFGDVVNTAKRIESSTPKDQITISDAVYQALNQKLNVQPLSPILVKGKVDPLIVWQLEPQ